MVEAHTDPALVAMQIVDPIWIASPPAAAGMTKSCTDALRSLGGPPRAAAVLERPTSSAAGRWRERILPACCSSRLARA